jgi:hypothetical protein
MTTRRVHRLGADVLQGERLDLDDPAGFAAGSVENRAR